MCFSAPKDNSAQIARDQENARQARITEGTGKINQQFSQFDDPYFQGIQQSALDFYNPDVNRQATDAREALTKNLARSGNLSGSVGATQFGDLDRSIAEQQAGIADRARNISLDARGQVDQNRSNLLSQLSSTADPYAAANAASAAASQLSAPQQFSPLGDLFSKFANIGASQVSAAKQGYSNPVGRTFGVQPATGSGSLNMVG
jgi:hypothetical protein